MIHTENELSSTITSTTTTSSSDSIEGSDAAHALLSLGMNISSDESTENELSSIKSIFLKRNWKVHYDIIDVDILEFIVKCIDESSNVTLNDSKVFTVQTNEYSFYLGVADSVDEETNTVGNQYIYITDIISED